MLLVAQYWKFVCRMNNARKICDQGMDNNTHHRYYGDAFIEVMYQYRRDVRELALTSGKYVDRDSLYQIINRYEEILKKIVNTLSCIYFGLIPAITRWIFLLMLFPFLFLRLVPTISAIFTIVYIMNCSQVNSHCIAIFCFVITLFRVYRMCAVMP
jgi:hypothetical protein